MTERGADKPSGGARLVIKEEKEFYAYIEAALVEQGFELLETGPVPKAPSG